MMLNKLSLNTIGLNRIGLNRIGKPSRGSSVRPYIDPEVLASLKAVCICYGKSNDDPDRAIVKNLVDPDNPFIISNAAYKLNSGYGKYEEDFTTWVGAAISINNGAGFKIERNNTGWWGFSTYGVKATNEFKIKVTNCRDAFSWRYKDAEGIWQTMNITKDGIYTLPASQERDEHDAPRFFNGNPNATYNGLLVEQIPSYQGAFVTDGVDDLITSTKTVQEMLGGSNECTVLSMMCQIGDTIEPFNRNNWLLTPTSYLESRVEKEKTGKTGIYGYTSTDINNGQISNINSILGDKNDYTANSKIESTGLDYFSVEGFQNEGIWYTSSVAWYWTIIANKVLTTDQINQVIAYYNLDRCVEPTVLYDVKRQGLSNDTPDSDWYLKDYSGNGYDMTLYNYAKTPESGINEDGGLQSDGVEDYGKVTGLPIYKDYTFIIDYERISYTSEGWSGAIVSKAPSANNGAFISMMANSAGLNKQLFSFGGVTAFIKDDLSRILFWQTKYKSENTELTVGEGVDGDTLWLGTLRDNDFRFFNGAIYSLMTFPYSMSEFLIERQLKKHKLGTLYPDMVEFRPIVNSNVKYQDIIFRNTSTGEDLVAGQYYDLGTISIFIKPLGCDEATAVKVNNVNAEFNSYDKNSGYYRFDSVVTKSPQKIDITIDEYIRYEDIVQPYPAVAKLKINERLITWGDKLKVGDEFIYDNNINLLPNMYNISATLIYNGNELHASHKAVVAKTMSFKPYTVVPLLANMPKCILSPQTLKIPNSSYRILGYIPDISGHGNHGKINNSAYAGMSGANGYLVDFNSWVKTENATLTDNKIAVIKDKITYQWISYDTNGSIVPAFKVNISGIPNGGRLELFDNNGTIQTLTNGVNDIEGFTANGPVGFLISSGLELNWSNLVIQQIGQYEGAYCLDGVDDSITIPTLSSGGKQVLMKVNWQSSIGQGMLYDQRGTAFAIWNSDKYNDDETDTIPAYSARNGGNTYIDGILNKNILASQLRNITHNIVATNTMLNGSSVSPTIGCRTEHDAYFTNMSLYDFMLFDEISTDEEILTLNEYVGIEGNTDDLFTENN